MMLMEQADRRRLARFFETHMRDRLTITPRDESQVRECALDMVSSLEITYHLVKRGPDGGITPPRKPKPQPTGLFEQTDDDSDTDEMEAA